MRAKFAPALFAFYGTPALELTRAQVWSWYAERDEDQYPDLVVARTTREQAYAQGVTIDDDKKKTPPEWEEESFQRVG